MTSTEVLTERDRFWLDHETALASSGQTAKAYSAERGISLHAMYQARKRLRAVGVLSAGRVRRAKKNPGAKSVAFSKVEFTPQRGSQHDFRLSFPSGLVLEGSGAELPTRLVDLVERLTLSR